MEQVLSRWAATVSAYADRKVEIHGSFLTGLVVAAGAMALSWFLYYPQLWSWNLAWLSGTRAHDYFELCRDPLARNLIEPFLAYRISVPTLAWLLGMRDAWAFMLECFFSYAFLVTVFLAAVRWSSALSATFATVMLALSFGVAWSNCVAGYPDSFSGFVCALALLSANPVLGAAIAFAGILNDERTVLAFPFLCLWWVAANRRSDGVKLGIGLLGGMIAAMMVRHGLKVGLLGSGVETPQVYGSMVENLKKLRPYTHSWPHWLGNVFSGYRWAWLAVPFFLLRPSLASTGERVWWLRPAYWVSLVLVTLSLVTAGDVARGTFFFFPAILLGLLSFGRDLNLLSTRGVALLALQVACPLIYFGSGGILQFFLPFPVVLLRAMSGHAIFW